VVGCVYIIDTIVFAAIPLLKRRRDSKNKTEYNEFTGIIGDKQTFRITTKRSESKSSLANEDVNGASDYGTVPKTPPVEYNHVENNMAAYNHKMAAQTWQ